eukprot:COSAG02_NODE_61342_length_269_cov_0.541176_1_plen_51_part_10
MDRAGCSALRILASLRDVVLDPHTHPVRRSSELTAGAARRGLLDAFRFVAT